MSEKKSYHCCLCGRPILDRREGNNPYPLKRITPYTDDIGLCCDRCNIMMVQPVRIVLKDYKIEQ